MIKSNDVFRPFITDNKSFEYISEKVIDLNKDKYFDYTASSLAFAPI